MGNRHTQPRPGLNQQPRTRVDLPNQHTNSRSSPRTLKEQPRKLGLAPPHLHTAGVRRRGLAAAAAALRLPPLLLPHRPRRRLLLPEPPKRTREPPSAAAGDASFSRWTSRGRETLASHHEPRLLERERERKKLPETPSRAEPLLRFRGLGLGGVWVASPFPFLPLSLSLVFPFPNIFFASACLSVYGRAWSAVEWRKKGFRGGRPSDLATDTTVGRDILRLGNVRPCTPTFLTTRSTFF